MKITNLVPIMKEGFVAMDKSKIWFWFEKTPVKGFCSWHSGHCNNCICISDLFDIEPVEDWTKSLIKVGE